ncbi:hypothetical protein SAMN04487894_101451 [Niabella drilacis]|uniref:Uncharacterized protein n=1 Tax=Niabella drilacis (strain DSM 25811 / CCM 8410 / CCUG 62505 / LMG 26954 / E90) TaxID=1285928 RepID=A0A1G6J881_NIADE|nr:hypothetical protein SAMN04487894_101451 [Niabella drilacis]
MAMMNSPVIFFRFNCLKAALDLFKKRNGSEKEYETANACENQNTCYHIPVI